MSRRAWLGACGLVAVTGGVMLPIVVLGFGERLPDPLASHWGADGRADAHLSVAKTVVSLELLWLFFCGIAVQISWRGQERRRVRAGAGLILGMGIGLVAGLLTVILHANLDAASWRDASKVGWREVGLLLLFAAATSLAGWLVLNRGPDEAPSGFVESPAVPLRKGEDPVWNQAVRNRGLLVLGLVMTAGGLLGILLVLLIPDEPLYAPAMPLAIVALCGLMVLAFSSARVTVDQQGLAVALGPLGWPVKRIALDRITKAGVQTRHPGEVGGWGYRTGLRQTTVMLRSGECLVVEHGPKQKQFAVSVDDAGQGAALLNSLRGRG